MVLLKLAVPTKRRNMQTKQRKVVEGEGGQRRAQNQENTGEVKDLLWCLHVSFFPRNETK